MAAGVIKAVRYGQMLGGDLHTITVEVDPEATDQTEPDQTEEEADDTPKDNTDGPEKAAENNTPDPE